VHVRGDTVTNNMESSRVNIRVGGGKNVLKIF